MKRLRLIASLAALVALAGCKDVPTPADATSTSAYVRAGQGVVVKSVRMYAPDDAVSGDNSQYYVVTFNWTNGIGYALTPQINHFVLQDTDSVRYLGVTTGSSALIGISNYDGQLKQGDSHDYTVGFRVPMGTIATLFYDPTF